MSISSRPLVVTMPRVEFLACVSVGDVELRETRGGGEYWVLPHRITARTLRCDSMVVRLIAAGWIERSLSDLSVTKLGQQILDEYGTDYLRRLCTHPKTEKSS